MKKVCIAVAFSFLFLTFSAFAEEETLLQKAERLQAEVAVLKKKAEDYQKKVEELKKFLPPPPTQAELDEDNRLRERAKEILRRQKELMEKK